MIILVFDDLLANPVVGFSWEGMVIEQIVTMMSRWRFSFLRTSNGAEIDLIMEKGNRIRVFELKASKAPKPGRGFWTLLESLKPEKAAVVSPVDQPYLYRQGVRVENLHSLGQMLLSD